MKRGDPFFQRELGFSEIGKTVAGDGGVVEDINAGAFITPRDGAVEAGVSGEML